jgi:ubiquinone biosynthesis protein
LHQTLTHSNGRVDDQIEQLVKQQKRLNRALFWMVLMLAVLFGVVALDLLWPFLIGYSGPKGLF